MLKALRIEYLKHKVLYDTIKREAEEVRSLLQGFQETAKDWEATMDDGHGTKVMWKPTPGSPIHTIRLDGKLNIPVFNILAVLMEVDLYLTWVPIVMGMGMKSIDLLADMDRFRKLVHADVALPWPIANRDANLFGYGVDLLDQGRVLAVARSYDCAPEVPHNVKWSLFPETEHLAAEERDGKLDETSTAPVSASDADNDVSEWEKKRREIVDVLNKVPTQVPKVKSKVVRAKIHKGGFLLTPLSEHETEISFLFQVDPDLAVVPSWLINWGMKHFSFAALNLLQKAAAKVGQPDSPYTQRMADKPLVYQYLRNRLAEIGDMTQDERDERRKNSLDLLGTPVPLHPEVLERFVRSRSSEAIVTLSITPNNPTATSSSSSSSMSTDSSGEKAS